MQRAVAVVADDRWVAKQGLSVLKLDWDDGGNAQFSCPAVGNAIVAATGQRIYNVRIDRPLIKLI